MRKVAIMEYYVNGDNDQQCENEAQQVAKYVRDKYDNHAKVTDLTRNEFGTIKSEKIKSEA